MEIYRFQNSKFLWIFWKIKLIDTHSCIYSSSTVLVILCSVTDQRAVFANKGVSFPFYIIRPWPVFRQFVRPTSALPWFSTGSSAFFQSLMKAVLFVWKRCFGRKMSNQTSQAVGMLFPYARLDVTSWGDVFLLCWVIHLYGWRRLDKYNYIYVPSLLCAEMVNA